MTGQSNLDVRKLVTGKDGRLFVTGADGVPIFLAEVDEFTAQLSPTNTDYQPVGSYLTYAVPLSYTITLTISEAVIRDDVMLTRLIDEIRAGQTPYYDFQGSLVRKIDNQSQRQVFRNCIPDGTIDLINLTPGDIVRRAWSFRCNAAPELIEYFRAA